MLASLTDPSTGAILVPGVMDSVAPLTPQESALYDALDFSVDELAKVAGAPALRWPSRREVLLHLWREPSLTLHGIEGAHAGAGARI